MKDQSEPFSRNLKFLCTEDRSVSEACRKMGFNRQQFAKYLNGSSKPSAHNMRIICSYFGIQEYVLYLPHGEFLAERDVRVGSEPDNRLTEISRSLFETYPDNRRQMRRYLGFYHFYFRSPTWPDKIFRGLAFLQEKHGYFYIKSFMRTQSMEDGSRYMTKYEGLATLRNNTIFIVEAQKTARDAIVETVLYPTFRMASDYISGTTFSVSAGSGKCFMVPIVWKYLGNTINTREALRKTGLYDPAVGLIEPKIIRMLDEADPR